MSNGAVVVAAVAFVYRKVTACITQGPEPQVYGCGGAPGQNGRCRTVEGRSSYRLIVSPKRYRLSPTPGTAHSLRRNVTYVDSHAFLSGVAGLPRSGDIPKIVEDSPPPAYGKVPQDGLSKPVGLKW